MDFKNVFKFFISSIIILLISSCEEAPVTPGCIQGEGTVTTSTLAVADFTGVDLAIASSVTIKQGASQKVEATGHPNIIDRVKTSVTNGTWKIDFEDGCYENYELSIEITVPKIDQLGLSGSGDLEVKDFTNQSGRLLIDLSGSGNITLNGFEGINELDVSLRGSGSIAANKSIVLATLNLANTGSGSFLGFNIKSDDGTVNLSGSGNCEITVQNSLDVTINGSGNISYKGMPTITEDISGSGKLIDAN